MIYFNRRCNMQKLLFCNLDLLRKSFDGFDNHNLKQFRDEFLDYADTLCNDAENQIYFISKDQTQLNAAEKFFNNNGYNNFKFRSRAKAKDFVMKYKSRNNFFVFISGKEVDFHLAVHSKSLFIVPTWIPVEDKSEYYGVHVDTPDQLDKFIRTLNNQESWYAKLEIEPNITALSLMDGRYKYKAKTENEREMIMHFEALLKQGKSRNYYDILLYHFLAGMTNTTLFDDIELFGMIPSSNCSLNEDIFSFMTQVRYIKGKRLPKNKMEDANLIQRITPKIQAHMLSNQSARANMGADYEFDTLRINPEFKQKIERLKKEGRFKVCIFDDYMTHGNTFNAVRNLLKYLGADKIIFVSLGNFSRPFQKKDYKITGNVFDSGYNYELLQSTQQYLTYDEDAKDEIDELYNIFNS